MNLKKLAFMICLILLGACSKTSPTETYDPYEQTNRDIFEFNINVQENILNPMAKGYNYGVPETFRYNITNFFKNLEEPLTFVNNILQADFDSALKTAVRFAINSTFGFAGLFEIADQVELPRHRETFNQTFGMWGISDGPYLILPFARPMNTRELVSFGFNVVFDPTIWVPPLSELSYLEDLTLWGTDVFNLYAKSMNTIESLKAQSLDFYEASKSSYQQLNYYDINDMYKTENKADTSSFDVDMDEE